MLKHFLTLEWKSFFRSASFKANLAIKIFMIFGALYFMAVIPWLRNRGFLYSLKSKVGEIPLTVVNQFMIYYLMGDLYIRYMFAENADYQY